MPDLFKDAPMRAQEVLTSAAGRFCLEDADLSTRDGWEAFRVQLLGYAEQIEIGLKLWPAVSGESSVELRGQVVTICDRCRSEIAG